MAIEDGAVTDPRRQPVRAAFRAAVLLRRRWTATVLIVMVLVAGCGQPVGGVADGAPERDAVCGTARTLDSVPKRVVVDHQRVAEIMVAIGEADRVVGVLGDMLSVSPPSVRDEVAQMPFLGGGPGAPIGKAQLQKVDPDAMLLTGAVEGVPTVGDVIELGAACGDEPESVDEALDEIVKVGRVFGAERRAQQVVERLDARIAELRATDRGDHPLVLTRAGTAQEPVQRVNGFMSDLVELAGGRDVVPDSGDVRADVRRSDAVAFVVVGHASEEDASGLLCSVTSTVSVDLFRSFPDIPATASRQAIVLPAASSFGGLRVVEDVEWLAGRIAAASSAG